MLILSRQRRQRVYIGSDVVVSVEGIQGGSVRLGVLAPADLPVYREELLDRVSASDRVDMLADPRDAELRRLRARVAELEGRAGAEFPPGPALAELDECEPAESETYTIWGAVT